jgi:hypothetical protein
MYSHKENYGFVHLSQIIVSTWVAFVSQEVLEMLLLFPSNTAIKIGLNEIRGISILYFYNWHKNSSVQEINLTHIIHKKKKRRKIKSSSFVYLSAQLTHRIGSLKHSRGRMLVRVQFRFTTGQPLC